MVSPSRKSLRAHRKTKTLTRRMEVLKVEELESRLLLDAVPTGYTPTQIRHAYALDRVGFLTTNGSPDAAKYNATAGLGQTIAIVDAYNDASLASDLHQFDLFYGLPDPPAFTQLDQSGGVEQPASAEATGWGEETSLDVEWAHALAPAASIVLVEGGTDLLAAVQTAASLPGVSVVSMSFGLPDETNQLLMDRFFTTPAGHQGVVFFASSGDSGAPPIYPSDSPNVVSVGGTTLNLDAGGNILSETAWAGSGGGQSTVEASSSFQNSALGQGTAGRATPDIGFDADPDTGVSLYDSLDLDADSPWEQVGGTSFSSPAWAAMTVLANQARAATGKGTLGGATQFLPLLYQLPAADFNDISGGASLGFPTISATAGYDQATGIGTPIASKLIPDLAAYSPPAALSTMYWSGAAGDNNWDNPANWSYADPINGAVVSAGALPGPNNDVVIDAAHSNINHPAGNYETLHSLSITARNVALNLSAGSIDLSSGTGQIGSLASNQIGSVITLAGGVLRNANLLVGSSVVVPAGSTTVLDGGLFAGSIQVKAGGTLALQGAWTNTGSIVVSGGATIYLGDSVDFDDAWTGSPTDPGSASHTWVNKGSISITSSQLHLGGLLTYTATNFSGLTLTPSDTIFLDGTLVNTGHTLALTSNWTIDGGRVFGGIVTIPNGSAAVVNANGGTFENLSSLVISGTLDLEGSPLQDFLGVGFNTVGGDAVLTIDNTSGALALGGAGTILFGASDSSVGSSDPRTGLADQIFLLGNAVTIPASMKIVSGGDDADGFPDYGILNGNFLNLGTINNSGDGEIDLDGSFTNQGIIEVSGGGFVDINATLINTGTVEEIGGGFLEIVGNVDNKGVIKETGGGAISINPDQFDPTNPDSVLQVWTNEKTISVTSGSMFLGGRWTNTASGTITAAQGATLQLGDDYFYDPAVDGASSDAWINNGAITATRANVYLGGFLSSAATNFGGLHLTTDDLYLAGTWVNTNATFVLKTAGNFAGSWVSVSEGLVYQGTVSVPAGNTVIFSSDPSFDDLTAFNLAGVIDLQSSDGFSPAFLLFDNPNNSLTIAGGGTLQFGVSPEFGGFSFFVANEIFVSGNALNIAAGVTIALPGVEGDGTPDAGEIDGPVINLGTIGGAAGGVLTLTDLIDNQGTLLAAAGSTLSVNFNLFDPTFGGQVIGWTNEGAITADQGIVQLGGSWVNGSKGKISANAGSTLALGDTLAFDPNLDSSPEADAWINNGSIVAAGASVYLGGWVTSTSANFNSLDLSTDDLILAGTIDNTSRTMAFDSAGSLDGSWVAIAGGSVFGGNVIILPDSNVLFDVAGATFEDLDSFTLDGTVEISVSDDFFSTTIVNFNNATGPLTIAGSGSIEMAGGSSFFAPPGEFNITGGPLTFSSGVSLVAGVEGSSLLIEGPVINLGLILANNGGVITIDGLSDNQGTIEATNTSEMFLNSDDFDPTDPTTLLSWTNEGTLEAVSGSELIVGGSWTNSSSGVIAADAGSVLELGDDLDADPALFPATTLDAWTNSGTITANGASVYLGGWLTLASTSYGGLELSSDSVLLAGTLDNAGQTLQITSTSSVDGNFYVDGGAIFQGTVSTDNGSSLVVDFGTLNGVTLNGSASVSDDGIAFIVNGLTLNGALQLGDSSDASATLEFDTSGGAQLLTGTGTILFGSAVDSTTIFSPNEIEIDGGSPLTIDTGITIVGPGVDAAALPDTAIVFGPVSMLGTVQEDDGGILSFQGPLQNLAAGTLTLGTWEVSNGVLQLPSDIEANAAALVLGGSTGLVENGAGTNGLTGMSANLAGGTLTIGGDVKLALTEAFANAGTLDVSAGGSLTDIGGYTQSNGSTVVDGEFIAPQVQLNGGMLSGAGTVQAAVTNAAIVSPGDDPGTLTIDGSYVQTAAGTLSLSLDAAASSKLVVTGKVTLDGTLGLVLASGYVPAAGTPITLFTFGQRVSGTDFATHTGFGIVQQEFGTLSYDSNSLSLSENSYLLTASPTVITGAFPPPSFSGTLATFTDNFTDDTPASFSVSIDWGDGTPLDTTSGAISFAKGVYAVQGSHTYASPIAPASTLPVTITITSLSADVSITTVNKPALGTFTGSIFDDANADGLLQTGELGLSGRTVFLDLNHNNAHDAGEPSATTDAKGSYQFQNVIPGRYTLVLSLLPTDSATSPAGVFITIQVAGGKILNSQNFGVLDAFGPLPVSTSSTPFGSNNANVQTATVNGLYNFILGRHPDAAGLTFWANALTTGVFTSAQLAAQFLHSPEYYSKEVGSLYRSILGRSPASPETQFWVGQMQAGMDASALAATFLKSGEYNAIHSADASFVQSLYVNVFGRGVDGKGLAYWSGQLRAGVQRSALAEYFLHSDELYERVIDNFYADYFGRPGDGQGMSLWLAKLTSGEDSLTDVALAFLGSGEFQSRAALAIGQK